MDFIHLCVLANMPVLLQTATDRLLALANSINDNCHGSSSYLRHLSKSIGDGKSLELARRLHGAKSPIAIHLEQLGVFLQSQCLDDKDGKRLDLESVPDENNLKVCEEHDHDPSPPTLHSDHGGWADHKEPSRYNNFSVPPSGILEVPRLPTAAEFRSLLLSARPFIIRGGAAEQMGLAVEVRSVAK